MATTMAKARARRLHLADGPSCHWPGEYLSSRIQGGHPAPAPTPSRLGTNDSFNSPQDRCILARSTLAESSTTSQAPQTRWSDASRSSPPRPDPTTSSSTEHASPRMADGRRRDHAGGRSGQGQFDHHCRRGQSSEGREVSQPRNNQSGFARLPGDVTPSVPRAWVTSRSHARSWHGLL